MGKEEGSQFIWSRAGSPGCRQEHVGTKACAAWRCCSTFLSTLWLPGALWIILVLPAVQPGFNKHNVKITALSVRSLRVKKQQVLSGTDFSTLLFSTLLFGCPGLCRDDLTLKPLP